MSIPDAVHNQTLPETAHGTWMILGVQRNKLYLQATGCGVDALRDALKDNECAFVLLALRLTLQEVPDQLRQIFIQWKGPEASAMSKVKANQLYQQAMDCLSVCAFFSFPLFSTLFFLHSLLVFFLLLTQPNHGQLEAVGKTEFTEEIISTKWQPSAGSHVIN